MTNDTIQNFIDEQRWRPIEEAPRDGTNVLVWGEQYEAVAYWWVNEWSPCSVLSGDSELNCSLSFTPTHFRPIPTDAPADVLQIAIDALREIRKQSDYCSLGVLAVDALTQIEARIGETK